jgi:hypothetical protein
VAQLDREVGEECFVLTDGAVKRALEPLATKNRIAFKREVARELSHATRVQADEYAEVTDRVRDLRAQIESFTARMTGRLLRVGDVEEVLGAIGMYIDAVGEDLRYTASATIAAEIARDNVFRFGEFKALVLKRVAEIPRVQSRILNEAIKAVNRPMPAEGERMRYLS